jgi:transposase-like protein
MRKYKPVELPLTETPEELATEVAECPNCRNRAAAVIGLLYQRPVFRCERCRVRFHRQVRTPSPLF